MENVWINKKQIAVPTSWAELEQDRELFIYVVNLFFKNFTKQQVRNIAGLKMCGLSDAKIQKIIDAMKNPDLHNNIEDISSNVFRASELAKFITKTPLKMTKNHFPNVRKMIVFYAPEGILKSCSVWEYALAEKAFFDFIETNNEEHLNKLISIIYRPKKIFNWLKKFRLNYDGDIRQKFSDYLLKKRTIKMQEIDFVTKWLIFRWFANEREQIIKSFPYTFPKGGKGTKKKVNLGAVWTDTILAMSQVGDEDKTANTKLSIILHRIETDNKNYQEVLKQQIKNNKNEH